MKSISFLSVALLALAAAGCPELGTQPVVVADDIPENPTWADDIKPIMDTYCNSCHSVPPTQGAPASLRLDVCETIGGIPGAQAMSIRNVIRTIDQLPSPMPPATFGLYPSADEQEIMQRWHDQGAPCGGAAPTNMMTNNVTANSNAGDMGTVTTPDMNTAVDMAMGPPDMGEDMAPDLPPTGPAWSVLGAQLVTTCGTATCHGQGGGRGGLEFADIATLQAVLENENQASNGMPYVRPEFPTQSALYQKMSDAANKPGADVMPPSGMNAALTTDVFDWITAGADFTQ